MKTSLQALSVLDDVAVIHRDIQPANILIDDKQNFFLADFGSARVDDWVDIGETSELKYMAPEAFQKKIDKKKTSKIDVWSLGVVFLETLGLLPDWPHPDSQKAALLRSGDQEWFALLRQSAEQHAPPLLKMLEMDVGRRYSARACLQRFFKGSGLLDGLPLRPDAVPQVTIGSGELSPAITSFGTGDVASAASTAGQPMISPFALVQRRLSVPVSSSAALQPAGTETGLEPHSEMERLAIQPRATGLSICEPPPSTTVTRPHSARTGLEAHREQMEARTRDISFPGATPSAWGGVRPVSSPIESSRANGRAHALTKGGRTSDLPQRRGRDGGRSQPRVSRDADEVDPHRRALQGAIETSQRALMREVAAKTGRDASAFKSSPQQGVTTRGRSARRDASGRSRRLDARMLCKMSSNPAAPSSASVDEWISDSIATSNGVIKPTYRPELSRFENQLRQRRAGRPAHHSGPQRPTPAEPQYLSQVCHPEARLEPGSVTRRDFRSEPFQIFRSPRRSRQEHDAQRGNRPDYESPPSSPKMWKGCCMIS